MSELPTSIARVITMSRNRAKACNAFTVEQLSPEGFVLCIRKGERVIAIAGADAKHEEILGLAAAGALARALKKMLTAVSHNDKTDAELLARAALFAAGVEIK